METFNLAGCLSLKIEKDVFYKVAKAKTLIPAQVVLLAKLKFIAEKKTYFSRCLISRFRIASSRDREFLRSNVSRVHTEIRPAWALDEVPVV